MAKDLLNGLTFVLVLLGTTASPLSAATLDKITASYGANFRLIIAAVGKNGSAGQPQAGCPYKSNSFLRTLRGASSLAFAQDKHCG